MKAFNVQDDPSDIWEKFEKDLAYQPCLFNVNTNRIFWHSGAGIDNPDINDRQKLYIKKYNLEIIEDAKKQVKETWDRCLKKI